MYATNCQRSGVFLDHRVSTLLHFPDSVGGSATLGSQTYGVVRYLRVGHPGLSLNGKVGSMSQNIGVHKQTRLQWLYRTASTVHAEINIADLPPNAKLTTYEIPPSSRLASDLALP